VKKEGPFLGGHRRWCFWSVYGGVRSGVAHSARVLAAIQSEFSGLPRLIGLQKKLMPNFTWKTLKCCFWFPEERLANVLALWGREPPFKVGLVVYGK
jgi:hypothetical protein